MNSRASRAKNSIMVRKAIDAMDSKEIVLWNAEYDFNY